MSNLVDAVTFDMDKRLAEHRFELRPIDGLRHWRVVRVHDLFEYTFNACECPNFDLARFPRAFTTFPTCLWCMRLTP